MIHFINHFSKHSSVLISRKVTAMITNCLLDLIDEIEHIIEDKLDGKFQEKNVKTLISSHYLDGC